MARCPNNCSCGRHDPEMLARRGRVLSAVKTGHSNGLEGTFHSPERRRLNSEQQLARSERQPKLALINSLKAGPCKDCGRVFPVECMDFDHVPDRGEKLFTLGPAGASCRPWDELRAEIDKCDVVCANCHRTRTLQRRMGARVEETG